MAEKKREIQRLVDSKHYKAAADRAIILFPGIGTCPEYHTLYTLKMWFQQYKFKPSAKEIFQIF
jgi:hypothetical protein